MLCPLCKVALSMSNREGVEIDYCPQCRGVWLDRGELDKIIERAGASLAPRAAEPHRLDSHRPEEHRPQRSSDDDDRHKGSYGHKKKHKSFLGELFDFD